MYHYIIVTKAFQSPDEDSLSPDPRCERFSMW